MRHVLRLLCVLVLLPSVLCFLTSCGSQKTIVNGLDEKEANEILVFLASKGITANKEPTKVSGGAGGGAQTVALYDINVPESSATEAMALLNMNGLPRRRGQNLLGLFQAGGLVPSELEEKVRYEAGLADQIANTIRKIDGVLDADVQLSFPEEDPLNPGKKIGKVTASVYVKHNGVLDDPNSHLITKIKRLVASSVPGLDFDNVTVISDRARFTDISYPGPASEVEEEHNYVKIWSIIVAKESAGAFRAVFFSLIFGIVLLAMMLSWIVWKTYPLLEKSGGLKQLFSIGLPIVGAKEKEEGKPSEKEELSQGAKTASTEGETSPESEERGSDETPEAS